MRPLPFGTGVAVGGTGIGVGVDVLTLVGEASGDVFVGTGVIDDSDEPPQALSINETSRLMPNGTQARTLTCLRPDRFILQQGWSRHVEKLRAVRQGGRGH